MTDVDSFLNIDIDTVEDPGAFAAMQEQFQGLEEDIKILAPTTEKLLEAGRAFLRTDQEDFVSSVRESLQEIEEQWSSICTRAARQLQSLTVIAAERREKMGGLDAQAEEIHRIRASLPNVASIDSLESLERAKESIQVGPKVICSKFPFLKKPDHVCVFVSTSCPSVTSSEFKMKISWIDTRLTGISNVHTFEIAICRVLCFAGFWVSIFSGFARTYVTWV